MKHRLFLFPFQATTPLFRLINIGLMLLCIGWTTNSIDAQSSKSLELKQKRLEERINLTKDLLKASEDEHQDALLSFQTLDEQILSRNELMQVYERFIMFSDSSQARSKFVISSLQKDLAGLQDEYGKIMQIALRQKLTDSKVLFLLSADNFSDVFRRWQFIKRYNETRHRQIENIQLTQQVLHKKVAQLETQKLEKLELIELEKIEAKNLADALANRDQILTQLSGSAQKLEAQLMEQERSRQELDRSLAALMQKQQAMTSKPEPKIPTATPSLALKNSAPPKSTNAISFTRSKGKLPWPVKEGVIIKKFGQQAHPTLKGIFIQNNGIDIACRPNASVLAVHGGSVTEIQEIAGYQSIIVIQHAAYYTVYSNLAYVDVQQGQAIDKGQIIGQLGDQSQGPLHFEVWHNKAKQNPQRWIKRK